MKRKRCGRHLGKRLARAVAPSTKTFDAERGMRKWVHWIDGSIWMTSGSGCGDEEFLQDEPLTRVYHLVVIYPLFHRIFIPII